MAKKKPVKKSSPLKQKRVKRVVKQQAVFTQESDSLIIEELTKRVKQARNYMFSRLAGVNSYLAIYDKHVIRDAWVKNKELVEQFKLPARFWKITLVDVIGKLKSLWSNTCNKIKQVAKENEHLTEDEKSYIRYVCSAPSLFGSILTRKAFVRPKTIQKLVIREKYIHNLINRYARRYRGKTPYSHSSTFYLDADMYNYERENGVVYICMSTHIKNNRIRLKCSDQNIYRKNICVTTNDNVFTLAHAVESKQKQIWSHEQVVGVDKGYRDMLVSSSGEVYGESLNALLNQETERLNELNQKRNPYYAMVRTLEEKGEFAKAERIRQNNLGKKKYNVHKRKHEETVKSMINHELNRFIVNEKPSVLGIEHLKFVSWDHKTPKHIKRKLARWIKGYIDERLTFKCDVHGIKYEYVNPAYTSQECHVCGCLGERTGQKFVCETCGTFNADDNAAKVVKKRLSDKEINLFTPYRKVKEILKSRKISSSF